MKRTNINQLVLEFLMDNRAKREFNKAKKINKVFFDIRVQKDKKNV